MRFTLNPLYWQKLQNQQSKCWQRYGEMRKYALLVNVQIKYILTCTNEIHHSVGRTTLLDIWRGRLEISGKDTLWILFRAHHCYGARKTPGQLWCSSTSAVPEKWQLVIFFALPMLDFGMEIILASYSEQKSIYSISIPGKIWELYIL